MATIGNEWPVSLPEKSNRQLGKEMVERSLFRPRLLRLAKIARWASKQREAINDSASLSQRAFPKR